MIQGFTYEDLGGGINMGGVRSEIQSREMQDILNFYPYQTRLRRRGGFRRLTAGTPTLAGTTDITSFMPYKLSDSAGGTWLLIMGTQNGFGKLVGTGFTPLALGGGVSLATIDSPWVFFQYKNYLYAMRKNSGTMLRIDGTDALRSGLSAPPIAPTIAQGAAGNLGAGNYIAVYTNYNRTTAMESNPSPASNTLTLAGSKTIDYTGIQPGADAFTDARRVYRTLANQVNVYFFVKQLDDNVTTSFTGENVAVQDMGRSVSFNNGLPPGNLKIGVIFNERLFASDGRDLFYSEFLLPECFGADKFLPVSPDDGHDLRGLHVFGDRLVIGKTNVMYYLVGADEANFGIHILDDRVGCESHLSMQSVEGSLFWFGSGRRIYRSDGTSTRDIATPRIAKLLDTIPDDKLDKAIGAIFPDLNWYALLCHPNNVPTVVIYNYKTEAFTQFRWGAPVAMKYIGHAYTSAYVDQFYAAGEQQIFQYDETYNYDDGTTILGQLQPPTPISSYFITKADDFGYPGYRKAYDQVWLLTAQKEAAVTLDVFRDNIATAIMSRTASLNIVDSAWKAYKLGTYRNQGTQTYMKLSYSGVPQIDIEGLHFEMALTDRPPGRPH